MNYHISRLLPRGQDVHPVTPPIPVPLAPEGALVPETPGAFPRRWLALSVLCLSLLIVTLDNTVLNVVLPTLVRSMHATSTDLQWIVDAYALVFGGRLNEG